MPERLDFHERQKLKFISNYCSCFHDSDTFNHLVYFTRAHLFALILDGFNAFIHEAAVQLESHPRNRDLSEVVKPQTAFKFITRGYITGWANQDEIILK